MAGKFDYRDFYRRNLPHYQPINGQFFITYRLAFSLPKRILEELNKKAEEFEHRSKNYPESQRKHLQRQYSKILFAMEDDFLGKYEQSPQWLNIEAIAEMILESLFFNHTRQYDLICALLMSNHVHIVIKPLNDSHEKPYPLSVIMRDHKSYTAHEANKLLGRTGAFWFHENYDHYIRNENEFHRVVHYILNNPVKAGLVEYYTEWKPYWINPDYVHI
jgi:REP element-mobilizing transposase RayT